MLIAKYVGDLLFDYECVVIPGLGGFIINDKPASINYDTDYFKPPFREIMFNPYLLTNDGLLLNYIAKEENVTYQEAKHKIDEFAIACHKALNSGKRIKFSRIGSIYKDNNDKIVFEQDKSVNYNPESFGLTSFISPSVRKISNNVKPETSFPDKNGIKEAEKEVRNEKRQDKRVTVEEETGKKKRKVYVKAKRSPYRGQVIFVLFLLFAMVSGWLYMNKDAVNYYYEKHGSKVPFFYSNNGSYLANNVEVIPLDKIADLISDSWLVKYMGNLNSDENKNTKVDDKSFVFDNEIETNKNSDETVNAVTKSNENATDIEPEDVILQKGNDNLSNAETEIVENNNDLNKEIVVSEDDNTEINTSEPEPEIEHAEPHLSYFIIAGSFKDKRNADRFISELKNKGYNAFVAGVNRYGMVRVAYSGFETISQAKQELTKIRNTDNPTAWIMRK